MSGRGGGGEDWHSLEIQMGFQNDDRLLMCIVNLTYLRLEMLSLYFNPIIVFEPPSTNMTMSRDVTLLPNSLLRFRKCKKTK